MHTYQNSIDESLKETKNYLEKLYDEISNYQDKLSDIKETYKSRSSGINERTQVLSQVRFLSELFNFVINQYNGVFNTF